MNDDETVISCPQGKSPERITQKGEKVIAVFAAAACLTCPCQDRCPAVEGKKGFYLRYKRKQVRLAVRRAFEKTDAFKQKYRWRAGEEGTNSLAKQKTGLGKLRVRGMKAVRFAVTLKWLGVNILRASAFEMAKKGKNGPKTIAVTWSMLRILAWMRQTGDKIRRTPELFVIFPAWSNQLAQNKTLAS